MASVITIGSTFTFDVVQVTSEGGRECCKDYPGPGNRSISYPYSSVGDTFTINNVLSLLRSFVTTELVLAIDGCVRSSHS